MKIGDYLIVMAVVLVVVLILAVALFRGDKMMTTLEFALVLTVAAIPVAVPAVLSVTMAVGARLLAAKRAIVSRLASIEELAGMDVLCSDKTGTAAIVAGWGLRYLIDRIAQWWIRRYRLANAPAAA